MNQPKNEGDPRKKSWTRRGFMGAALTGIPAFALGRPQVPSQPASAAPTPAAARIREFRTLGRTGFRVSDVSFGAGNLTNANVLQAALDRGMNYIDTAEHYVNGNSERTIGESIKTRDRNSVFLTTKLNLTFMKPATKDGIKDRFRKCLERLGTDHADCLMIHLCTLAQVKWEPYHEAFRELKAEGKVRFSGLSNHGADNALNGPNTDTMEDVVAAAAEDGRFDVVLCALNFLKTEAAAKIFAACGPKNIGITLMKMNPALTSASERRILDRMRERYKTQGKELPDSVVKLGKISEDRAAAAEAFLKKHGLAGPEQTREAAIKYCLSLPEVHCVCPSINSFEELDVYVPLSGTRFSEEERDMLADAEKVYGDLTCRIGCGRCEPACPRGVPVNSIMRYEYYFRAQRREKAAMAEYASLAARDAAGCADCPGWCERACPYGVPIQGKLLAAHEQLSLV